jgi:hypothetical protein
MVKGNKKWFYILGLLAVIVYIFIVPRSIPEETILKPRWITSMETNYSGGNLAVEEFRQGVIPDSGDFSGQGAGALLPFTLGDRFGYVRDDGKFVVNQIRSGYICLSENYWAEYGAQPSSIQIMNPMNGRVLSIEGTKGYPLILDNRFFVVGIEQNSLVEIGSEGEELWTHDFPSPITCVDAASGYVLAGTLDGAVELLNYSGLPVFSPFEPGGSRLSVILGCAISRDASRLAIISGINDQRFLLLERSSGGPDTYKVVFHEFLTNGFRRPVHISFVSNDEKVAFEREEGLGIFDIGSRTSINVPLEGEIAVMDNYGGDDYLFVIISQDTKQKRLITIRYPGIIVSNAPFASNSSFFARRGRKIYLGSDSTMVSFELEKK